ncbi:metal-dependent amidase/aminoacylase/carboxypeptidase [Aspergillus oryzae 100-8]|uniref:Peptidase M20 domain-containing protein 2 n=1 Tax=Aspergillus oryzae (strain 3.042) TaxID=1160506 RepID=I8I8Z7_ASPO3|nr:metal-dependent amidase/aminoacylase/carboxypeptidase [Aspergillus oryzae 3.042]KDE78503.1 metal-dependent amidase/aminoacylase/carboxypeptidase [Aspergillus oryzae 100-8]|eukprot:EIT73591.1 metal-dependent amidase/aminoacylase/carboxypeptidase [Aspergillus oryzae 3.042]
MTQITSNLSSPLQTPGQQTGCTLDVIVHAIDAHDKELQLINEQIHKNPELAFEEFKAHDNITTLLKDLGFSVTKHAYGLATAFVAEYGSGGRVVAFNAEYDALPGIGHACGHNLIATSSIGAYLGVVAALKASTLPGRVRLIGTPAEEDGGGKIKLIEAGAYEDVDACLMVHPAAHKRFPDGVTGVSYVTSNAIVKFRARFTGKPAHAAGAPWQGINALDAVCLSYNGVSMLRQQIQPHERIHGVIVEGGTKPNVITASGTVDYFCRSTSLEEAEALKDRVIKCFDGAAIATGCSVEYETREAYADLRPNKALCANYDSAMATLGFPVASSGATQPGSTDMGNVTYVCPGFHGGFAVPADPGAFNHTPSFTKAAGTSKAYELALNTAKGMAVVGWNVLSDDSLAESVRNDFEEDKKMREASRR